MRLYRGGPVIVGGPPSPLDEQDEYTKREHGLIPINVAQRLFVSAAPLIIESLPLAGGVGSWGLLGAATYGEALQVNDGDTSRIRSGCISDLDVAVRMAARVDPGTDNGFFAEIVARQEVTGGCPGGLLNGCEFRISINNPNYSLGAGTDITGGLLGVPNTALLPYVIYTVPIPPAAIALMNFANYWFNFRAGTGNTGTYAITKASLKGP